MEGENNTGNLFPLVRPTKVKLEDQEQYDDLASTDTLDNDIHESTLGSVSNVSHTSSVKQWRLFGKTVPKNEVIFICQVVILYIVIITCIINLSLRNGDSNLWTALLSSSMGIMLPAPTLSKRRH